MERKKEKILLASLRRRQEQEENKARMEHVSAIAKEREQTREERVAMKREEDKARRASILNQYKLKKAIDEAEREVRSLDLILKCSETKFDIDRAKSWTNTSCIVYRPCVHRPRLLRRQHRMQAQVVLLELGAKLPGRLQGPDRRPFTSSVVKVEATETSPTTGLASEDKVPPPTSLVCFV
jgi:hypothetical protein